MQQTAPDSAKKGRMQKDNIGHPEHVSSQSIPGNTTEPTTPQTLPCHAYATAPAISFHITSPGYVI
jgi:hypothetical protein